MSAVDALCERCGKPVTAVQTADDPELWWVFDYGQTQGFEHECMRSKLFGGAIRGVEFYTAPLVWTLPE